MKKAGLPAIVDPWNKKEFDRVNRDPVSAMIATYVTGATAGTTLVAAVGASMWGWVAVYAVSTIAITAAVSWAIGQTLGRPQLDFPATDSGGTLVNSRGALKPQEFVYGKVRKGGVETFIKSTGGDNKILHKIIVLAGHECNSIGDIYLNDEVVTMSGDTVTSSPWNSKIKIYKHLGAQTSATDTFSGSSSTLNSTLHSEASVESSFVGKGMCYLYVRMEYDQDVFANGVPIVTAVVEGKKVYNSATDTTAYSANAALVIRDFVTSAYGLNDDQVDDTSFENAASICDDTITTNDGTENKYEINGVVRSNEQVGNVLQNFMTACGGTLFYGGGYWRLNVANYVTPTKTFTLDDLRSGISLDTKVPMQDNFNTVRGTYIDKDNDWVSGDYPEYYSSTFATEDNGELVATNLDLPFTTSGAAAQRIAKLTLLRSREQLSFSADFGLNAIDVEVGDIIKLNIARYGWDTTPKEFEVTGWRLVAGEAKDLLVNLQLRETSQAAFSWSVANEQTITRNNTQLLKYYEVPSIGLTVSQEYRVVNENVTTALVANVSTTASERIDYVTLEYKRTSDTDYKLMGQGRIAGSNNVARFEANDIDVPQINEAAINYTVRATPVNNFGYRGTPQITTINVTADTTAPASPSSLSHQISGGPLFFSWPAVSDLDLSHYSLWFSSNTSASFTDASTLRVIDKIARPATSITYPARAGTFFVSAIDKTGNESATAASTSIAVSELPSLGQTHTDEEHNDATPFSGTTSNVSVTSNKLLLTTYTSSGSTGTYDFYHDGDGYIDVGSTRTIRISYGVVLTRKHALAGTGGRQTGEINWDEIPGNWDTWPDDFDDWTLETTDFGDYNVAIQLATSTDASTWSSYSAAGGEVTAQYVRFRAVLSNANANVTPLVSELTATAEY